MKKKIGKYELKGRNSNSVEKNSWNQLSRLFYIKSKNVGLTDFFVTNVTLASLLKFDLTNFTWNHNLKHSKGIYMYFSLNFEDSVWRILCVIWDIIDEILKLPIRKLAFLANFNKDSIHFTKKSPKICQNGDF